LVGDGTRRQLRRLVGERMRTSRALHGLLHGADERLVTLRHMAGVRLPALVRPRPYKVMIALTAHCNARCIGCRYGRDFMPGAVLETELVHGLLEDAAAAGFRSIRLYGGEPLLHPDLAPIVARCVALGLRPYVTTNAVLLDEQIDALVAAGLRDVTIGFYGVGQAYDDYVQRPGLFERIERGLTAVRARHSAAQLDLQLNWLFMRPTASVAAFRDAVAFAERFGMSIRVDLIHYSLPYFQEGPDGCLQFRPEDRGRIEAVVEEMLALKRAKPELLRHSLAGLRSIPDWLILGPDMKVPCTAYEMIWVGADGTVQMCYVTFRLGNLHERRLADMLGTRAHRCAARSAVRLECPNCHCSSNERVMRHLPTRARYAAEGSHRAGGRP
jgi:molybdenum cofactor biosynthesis enzyme MoaA